MSNPIYESFPQRTQSYRVTPERDVLPARPQSAAPPEMYVITLEEMIAVLLALSQYVITLVQMIAMLLALSQYVMTLVQMIAMLHYKGYLDIWSDILVDQGPVSRRPTTIK